MRCIPVLPGSPKLQSYLLHWSDRPRPFNVSVLFSFSLLLFCFLVWYSHIESARCVIVYHSCVPVHTSKRSMSRLSNPITPTDFLLLRTAYHIFTTFPWLFLVSIGQKLCEYRLATHTLSPTHMHTLNPHVYILTYVCIIITCTYSVWCVYTCIHMCTCSYRPCLALKALKTWLVGCCTCDRLPPHPDWNPAYKPNVCVNKRNLTITNQLRTHVRSNQITQDKMP